jgi:heptosyltransferase-2
LSYKRTYTFPFKFLIPNYKLEYLNNKSLIRGWLKFAKRYLFILINWQKPLEIFTITNEHKYILWINFSAPSLGDSLMDLSSRVLLTDKKIDLLTDKKNASLYCDDSVFVSIYTDTKQVLQKNYDLVIVDSYSTRSIRNKIKVAKSNHYVGMFGYFNGPEVNRVLFSFHQMNKLLGYFKNESEINNIARSSITISSNDQKFIEEKVLPLKYIAIAIGGEWDYRIYRNWQQVIGKLLSNDKSLQIVILGSNNANNNEKKILEAFPASRVKSYVAKLTFNQTAEVIRKADFLLCCDGGLMHAAIAVDTIIISLFARLEVEMQLTFACKAFPLYDPFDVNNISVDDILIKYNEAISYDYNHLQNE